MLACLTIAALLAVSEPVVDELEFSEEVVFWEEQETSLSEEALEDFVFFEEQDNEEEK